MPLDKYVNITIGGQQVHITDADSVPVAIDYSLEDPDNFQQKKSAESLGLTIPATLFNERAANTFRNDGVEDMSEGQAYRNFQRCVIEANGHELLVGKALLKSATHKDLPQAYQYDVFGDNADWIIDLKEKTLYDFVSFLTFTYSELNIFFSWNYDGRDESAPYVFAPVRYRPPMGGYKTDDEGDLEADNTVMDTGYLRPAISKYYILYWALKSIGYKIKSTFLDSDFFRRQVMPWTWGAFLDPSAVNEPNKFLAKSTEAVLYETPGGEHNFYHDLKVSNDSTDGAFDANDVYAYNAPDMEMVWEYKEATQYGRLLATFSFQIDIRAFCGNGAGIALEIHWFKTDTSGDPVVQVVFDIDAPTPGVEDEFIDIALVNYQTDVLPNDVIIAKFYIRSYKSAVDGSYSHVTANVLEYELDFMRIPIDGTIFFENYTAFKNYKILDYFRGIIDEFNLSLNTDPVNRVVFIEPTHAYSLTSDLTIRDQPGYFLNDHLDWSQKGDLNKEWKMESFSDGERELTLRYKDDGNDGLLKLLQDRNSNILGSSKYVFPERFKVGAKTIENRFFSATVHFDVDEWKGLSGIAPQMIAIIPENISNTSSSEADNSFNPKSCYYKGKMTGVGHWLLRNANGITLDYDYYPYMFAVNYKPGGENDPVLSYSDERISVSSGDEVVASGLLKRFYWQRFAIMRNGQWYNTWMRLNNKDVVNHLHREYKIYNGQRYELIQISGYKPLKEDSTACLMRKWAPVIQADDDNTFPSAEAVISEIPPDITSFDMKYARLMALINDIPTT